MTRLTFDPAYSAGVRDLLLDPAALRHGRRRRHVWIGGSLVVGLSLLGAGGAIAADFVMPGADVVTPLDSARTVEGTGAQQIDLGTAPAGTDSLETTLSCLGVGTVTWPDGASMTCRSQLDLGTGSTAIPWSTSRSTFRLGATPGTRWRLTYTFSDRRTTALKTNANGRTYGTDAGTAHPDLIAAVATNGREGYISKEEVDAVSCGDVTTPKEAVACTQAHEARTEHVPVYESDGVTRIGVFTIGG